MHTRKIIIPILAALFFMATGNAPGKTNVDIDPWVFMFGLGYRF